MSEDDVMYWQDALDEVAAGRTTGLRCPFCDQGEVVVERDPPKTRLECRACHRFIEGRMANE
jgi:hypothetical protein